MAGASCGARERLGFEACGAIKPRPRDPFAQRLLVIHEEIVRLIDVYAPAEVAIEDPFVGALQPASALAIGQARAAAVLAAAAAGLEVELYAPAAVKAAVSGYGQGDKRQVQVDGAHAAGAGGAAGAPGRRGCPGSRDLPPQLAPRPGAGESRSPMMVRAL